MRNLILDMGNVLLDWNPRKLAQGAAQNPEDAQALCAALFLSPEWPQNDEGLVSDREMLEIAMNRAPSRLHGAVKHLHENWPAWIEALPGAEDFVRRAKAGGLRVYLLSNAGVRFPDCLARFAFYPLLDGALVSAHEKIVKPDRRIFELLLERYGLNARECFFVDDYAPNVEGARAVGIDGVTFDGDFSKLTAALIARGMKAAEA